MLPVVLVPLGHRRVLVHVFDDLPPAHAGVVSAEADLSLLRGVRDDAHFRAAEVVVDKSLNHIPAMNKKFQGLLWRRFMASSYVRCGYVLPYFVSDCFVRAQVL